MNSSNSLVLIARKIMVSAICVISLNSAMAGALEPAIDDFSDQNSNSLGITRQLSTTQLLVAKPAPNTMWMKVFSPPRER